MGDIALSVENVSKLYRLGTVGTGTLRSDFERFLAKLTKKEDPFLKIGQENIRSHKISGDYVLALKDINFEVKKGEVLGIIGRNGAGKSTLLKLLSKITAPSTGKIKVDGRIASLLEVGTGFHPELTGRENVFMNGAILGMRKWEIQRKFDEIVDFSGVEAYIDTPVKRYSSGMYVRLAFAVAAYLDPEILIVDEVLAVGDAEFQKKCLARMQQVSLKEGRTILFVSHNMAAIKNLCNRCVLLSNGSLHEHNETSVVLSKYMELTSFKEEIKDLSLNGFRKGTGNIVFQNVSFENMNGKTIDIAISGESLYICFDLIVKNVRNSVLDIGFSFHTLHDEILTYLYSSFDNSVIIANDSKIRIKCLIRNMPLAEGIYYLRGRILENGIESDWPEFPLKMLKVEYGDFYNTGKKIDPIAPVLIKGVWN